MKGKAPLGLAALLLLASCAGPDNLHRVDARVWRSSQPTRHEFRKLREQGIGEVLCLRRWHSDKEEAPQFKRHHVRMRAGRIRDEEMVAALRVMIAAEEPLLVHCFHGSDRTGAVVAMYRMLVQGWPRERAIAELLDPRHGHHAETFPNIRDYLETVDLAKIRRELGSTNPQPRAGAQAPSVTRTSWQPPSGGSSTRAAPSTGSTGTPSSPADRTRRASPPGFSTVIR
jgi:protein tyrosine/serine phosphatase